MEELEKALQEIELLKQQIAEYEEKLKKCNEINDQLCTSLLEATKQVREYENLSKAKRLFSLCS